MSPGTGAAKVWSRMAVNRRPAAVTRSERDGFGDRYEFGVGVGGTPWVAGPGMGRPLPWVYETVEIFCVRGLSAFHQGWCGTAARGAAGASVPADRTPIANKEKPYGTGNREMVQQRQGLRLHLR